MRILYVIDSLSVGGAEMLLLDLIDAAQARGWEVRVAYFTPGPLADTLTKRGVDAIRLGRHGLRNPLALLRAFRLMRSWQPDVVHTHLTKSDLVGQIAARAARVGRRVMTIHCEDQWRQNGLLSRIYRLATRGVSTCIAVSHEVAAFTIETGSIAPHTTIVIDNGVDTQRFDPDQAQPLALDTYGVKAGSKVVAVIGRLKPQKDHNNFLAAARILAQQHDDLHFIVVGQGELEADLRAQAEAAGLLPDRLTFTGLIRDVPGLLAAVDIVVISSAWEGLPVILLEAMAMGRPVASTRVGGIPGAVRDGTDAILVPPGDPTALADAIGRLATQDDLRTGLGHAARQSIVQNYSGAVMISRTFDVYADALRPA